MGTNRSFVEQVLEAAVDGAKGVADGAMKAIEAGLEVIGPKSEDRSKDVTLEIEGKTYTGTVKRSD